MTTTKKKNTRATKTAAAHVPYLSPGSDTDGIGSMLSNGGVLAKEPARILTLEQAAKIDAPSITDAGTVAPIVGDVVRAPAKKRAHATTAHVFALRAAYRVGAGATGMRESAGVDAINDVVLEWESETPGIARKALRLALVKLTGDAGICQALRHVLDHLPAEVVAVRGGARRSGLRKINVNKKGQRMLLSLAVPASFTATHVRMIERDGCLVLEPVAAEGGV